MLPERLYGAVTVVVFLLAALSSFALAHGDGEGSRDAKGETLEQSIRSLTLTVIYAASALLIILTAAAILGKRRFPRHRNYKALLFSLIVAVTASATIFTAGSTIYLNAVSHTGGPVHWHADFEVWNCGEKVDLKDPEGLSNRIGSSSFHEHGDDRIHMEGVVTDLQDASLHEFFHLTGSELSSGLLDYNTNHGIVRVKDGDTCNGVPGKLQVFVYRVTNPDERGDFVYGQVKLDDYESYVLSPHSNVPPGDCIIIEFDREKSSTDRICETYRLAIERGELRGG